MKLRSEKIESTLKSLRIADVELFIGAALMKSLGKSATYRKCRVQRHGYQLAG